MAVPNSHLCDDTNDRCQVLLGEKKFTVLIRMNHLDG